jgi:hypothetical protein
VQLRKGVAYSFRYREVSLQAVSFRRACMNW